MSDQGTPETEANPQTETEAPAESGRPDWLDPIEQRMDELRDQNMAIADQFRQMQPVEDDEDFDIDELYGDDGELTPEAAQALIDQRVNEAVSSQLSQRDAANALEQREYAFDDLRERVPALQDDRYAAQIVREVAGDLEGPGYGALVKTPLFVDLIEQRHKAGKFDEQAAAEQPPPRGVVLESAQGAAPQQQDQEDWGERIVKAAERLRPKI